MDLSELQIHVKNASGIASNPFRSSSEIMLASTEELGEVAQEVALLEKIGTKAQWTKQGDKERLGKEIVDLMNCVVALANHYDINLADIFVARSKKRNEEV